MTADSAVQGASIQVSPDGLSLIAIVTPNTCQSRVLQSGISKILPSHMLPSMILPVSSMRDILKQEQKPLASEDVVRGTWSRSKQDKDVEKFLSNAWKEEIGLSIIPKNDVNFFDVGGHR